MCPHGRLHVNWMRTGLFLRATIEVNFDGEAYEVLRLIT